MEGGFSLGADGLRREWPRSSFKDPGCVQMSDFATAVALVLVLEGLLWALMPDGMKRAAMMALSLENGQLRHGGLVAAGFGVFLIWLMRG